MQLYQQNWATFGSSSSSSTAFPLYAWGHNYGGKVHHEKRTNASTRKKQTLLVSSHGNNVGSCHFESRDNPEGWGSEIGYEFTQQCKTAKPGSAWGGATTFLGSWRPPTGSTGQRGPPVSVPSCSLQLGPHPMPRYGLSPYCGHSWPKGATKQRKVISTAATQTAQRHQLDTPESASQWVTKEQGIPN